MTKEKAQIVENGNALIFWCEGCNTWHLIHIKKYDSYPVWDFNNDLVSPTLSPSVLVTNYPQNNSICHSFIRDGKIQYLNDCTHSLKGKTIELKSDFERW